MTFERALATQPGGGFEGFPMSQKVADANDLPRAKLNELSDFMAELDAGRPGGEVHLTDQQDRLAEVAELLRPTDEAFPLPPRYSRQAASTFS